MDGSQLEQLKRIQAELEELLLTESDKGATHLARVAGGLLLTAIKVGDRELETGVVVDMGAVILTMPMPMLDDMRQRANRRQISVPEHIRRAVAFERLVFEDPPEPT